MYGVIITCASGVSYTDFMQRLNVPPYLGSDYITWPLNLQQSMLNSWTPLLF